MSKVYGTPCFMNEISHNLIYEQILLYSQYVQNNIFKQVYICRLYFKLKISGNLIEKDAFVIE